MVFDMEKFAIYYGFLNNLNLLKKMHYSITYAQMTNPNVFNNADKCKNI